MYSFGVIKVRGQAFPQVSTMRHQLPPMVFQTPKITKATCNVGWSRVGTGASDYEVGVLRADLGAGYLRVGVLRVRSGPRTMQVGLSRANPDAR